jgi:hypothetical protein
MGGIGKELPGNSSRRLQFRVVVRIAKRGQVFEKLIAWLQSGMAEFIDVDAVRLIVDFDLVNLSTEATTHPDMRPMRWQTGFDLQSIHRRLNPENVLCGGDVGPTRSAR